MLRFVTGGCVITFTLLSLLMPSPLLAAAPEQLDVILKRLDALEQENRQLKENLRNLERQVYSVGTSLPPRVEDEAPTPRKALDVAVSTLPASEPKPASQELAGIDLGTAGRLRLIDISLDVLTVVGGSSERDDSIKNLQGGGHDPKRRGFTLQQAELSLIGAVDPYFQAEAHILASEDGIELEEAFVQSTALPWSTELEVGYFLTEFGRINPLHPHAWKWLDQPIINTRLFGGEGMRGAGIRISKLLPVPWYSNFHLGAQNADGDFMASFLGGEIAHEHGGDTLTEGDHEHDHALGIAGRPVVTRQVRDLGDLVYLARWENALALSATWNTKVGFSALYGPNFTGSNGDTWIYGSDLLLKWVPETNEQGRPFLLIEAEIAKRDLAAASFIEENEGNVVPADSLQDWGGYLQALYGFRGNWATGLRFEYASGSGANLEHEGVYPARQDDPFRDNRLRISPLLSYTPSEFSRVRLQYNYDEADHLKDPAHSVWLGLEVLIGAHPAHTY